MLARVVVDRGERSEPLTRAMLISDVAPSDSLRLSLQQSPLDVRYSPRGPHAIAAAVEARPQLLLVDCRSDEPAALLFRYRTRRRTQDDQRLGSGLLRGDGLR